MDEVPAQNCCTFPRGGTAIYIVPLAQLSWCFIAPVEDPCSDIKPRNSCSMNCSLSITLLCEAAAYFNSVADACHREIRLFAELLYHGLTTGAGLQTLGEEYCDILQVSGQHSDYAAAVSSLCRSRLQYVF